MAVYGYICMSGAKDSENEQLLSMSNFNIPTEHLFIDKQSGKSVERSAYRTLLEKLHPGDLLYIKSIDQLGLNYDEIWSRWLELTKEYGVDIVAVDTPMLDTRTGKDLSDLSITDIVIQVLLLVKLYERENYRKKQSNGIAAAKARGVRFGRPVQALPENFSEIVQQWERKELTLAQVLEQTGLKEATFFRRLREFRTQN